ncbi:hypothetical protein A1O1_06878 [Capronia coronata CBS 617.96]|uniref:Uncharacterized protein n=1 Tax=Capronia coronata CBS 617.96 TaxID=1182541 RepID=W9YLW6_9EURO|nr:uncharacterized protein A1O1_06878 [Capronia coronata CBS 617.96]EXJ83259.1 hypothetical protein A1O1_06878 [Capronia coronata CBS 617.96]
MPTLKDLVCQVLWADTASPFPEHGTQYGDGVVETYIAIPSHPQAFNIRLSSRKFIYEGLAMVVFIDGEYQCNRNRVNLQPPRKDISKSRSVVEFVVRQKEKPMGDGTYMGREWRFDDYNLVPKMPQGIDDTHFRELGTIEVLVLRCRMSDVEEDMSTSSSAEDSDIFGSRVDSDGQSTCQSRTTSQGEAERAKDDTPENEADSLLAGMTGLFDGPGDEYPPMYDNFQGDAPPNRYPPWAWHSQGGQSAPYSPHEATSYAQNYRPDPFYQHPGGPSHTYRPTSSTPSYEHHAYRPPRPERRVHFDLGDGRGPQQHHRMTSDMRYDDRNRYYVPGAWREEHDYNRPVPDPTYRERSNHRGTHSYADYPPSPRDRHYMYDAEEKAYSHYPDVNLHDSYPPRTPSASSYMQHGNSGHPFPPYQAHLQPTGIPMPGPTPLSFPVRPSAPPHSFPAAPWTAMNPQPVPVVWPLPLAGPAQPPIPGTVPVYPPPNNAPLFHASAPNPAATTGVPPVSTFASSGPGPAVSQADADTAWMSGAQQTPAVIDTEKEGNQSTTNTDVKDAEDPPRDAAGQNSTYPSWNDNKQPDNASNDSKGSADNNSPGNDQANNEGHGWDQSDQNAKGWGDDEQKADSGNKHSNGGWDNYSKDKSNGNNKSSSNATKRALYGPYGAYFTTKAAAETAVSPDAEEEPRYDVPRAIAENMGTSKQVQPGPGYIYNKKRCVPEYVDSLAEPYARFVFKYRTKEQIKKEIGIEVGLDPTPNEDANTLESLDKAELIEMVLRAKGALGGKIPSPPAKITTPASTHSNEQIPVSAPDVGFLSYKLPAARKVSDNPGLGIQSRLATSPGSRNGSRRGSATNEQQNASWADNGPANWQDEGNNNQQSSNNEAPGGGWDQNNNEANNTRGGWDGQQERSDATSPEQKQDTPRQSWDSSGGRSAAQDEHGARPAEDAWKKVSFHASGVVQPATTYSLSQEGTAARTSGSTSTFVPLSTPDYSFVPQTPAYAPARQTTPSIRGNTPVATPPWMQANHAFPINPSPPVNAAMAAMPYMPRYPTMAANPAYGAHTPVPIYPWPQATPPTQAYSTMRHTVAPTMSWTHANTTRPGYVSMPVNPGYPTTRAYPTRPPNTISPPAPPNVTYPAYPAYPWSTPPNPVTATMPETAMPPGVAAAADPWAQQQPAAGSASVQPPSSPPLVVTSPHPIYSPGTAALVAENPMYEEMFLKNRPVGFDPGPRPPTPPKNPAREWEHGREEDKNFEPIGPGWSSGLPYEW